MADTPLLYQDELNQFLMAFITRKREESKAEMIEHVRQDMLAAFHEIATHTADGGAPYPALHPIALAKKVLHGRSLARDEAELSKLTEIIEKTYPRDTVTGFYAKQCMPVMVGMAHMLAQRGEAVPVSLVEGDFSNMGGCNKSALGREGTDKLIHRICMLLEQSFGDYAKAHGIKAEVQGIRAGGDEVRLVVYGLTPAQVEEVLEKRVHPQINLLAAEFGVHQTPHEKKGKLPGFGAAFAAVDLKKQRDPARIRALLDAGIERQKADDGLLRLGMVDKDGVERYLNEIYLPYLKESGLDGKDMAAAAAAKNTYLSQKAALLASRWDAMTHEAGFPAEYGDGAGKNPRDFFDAYSKAHAKGVQAKLAAITLKPQATPVPFAMEEVKDQGEAPESTRLRKALKALGFTEVAEADRALFQWNQRIRRYDLQRDDTMKLRPERARCLRLAIDLMRQFDAPDPASRLKSPSLLPEDAAGFAKRHDGMKVAQFELGNVNGLNAVDYDLADAVLRETGKYIQDGLLARSYGLGSNILDYLYHEGGGRYTLLLPPDYPTPEITALAQEVNAKLDRHVRNATVADFARATYANPSGARAEASGSKISALTGRLAQIEAMLGRPCATVGQIPHPKDRGKSLTFKHHTVQLGPEDIGMGGAAAMAQALNGVSARSEIAFSRGGDMLRTSGE